MRCQVQQAVSTGNLRSNNVTTFARASPDTKIIAVSLSQGFIKARKEANRLGLTVRQLDSTFISFGLSSKVKEQCKPILEHPPRWVEFLR